MTTSFADLGVPADLVAALAANGIMEPFPVQEATLPDALARRDVSGKAPTGSGKTLAFGLAILSNVGKGRSRRPRALVLAPTRELAGQIDRALRPLAKARGRWVESVYGGVGYERQTRALAKGVDVLVACPGRLEDLLARGQVHLDEVECVVVDEADRMADMGFLPPVRRILDQCSPKRQTLLFSATLDGAIGELVERYQRDPVVHEVGSLVPDALGARHIFWKVPQPERSELTAQVVRTQESTIVFCRTRHGVDRLVRQLERLGVGAIAIHGGRSQQQRDRALASFTRRQVRVLVATDVAARGIHIDGVALVIHFDPPADEKDYLHRSGRTARAGAGGLVLSYVPPQGAKQSAKLRAAAGGEAELTRPDLGDLDAGDGGPDAADGTPAAARPAAAPVPAAAVRRDVPVPAKHSGAPRARRHRDLQPPSVPISHRDSPRARIGE